MCPPGIKFILSLKGMLVSLFGDSKYAVYHLNLILLFGNGLVAFGLKESDKELKAVSTHFKEK